MLKSCTREWNAHVEDFWACTNVQAYCVFQHFHETDIIDAHSGLSNTGILCSQTLWAFICLFDWKRLPTVELERHYLQNGRDDQHTECKCIGCAHAAYYDYKCLTECLVQTTVVSPS